MATTSIQSITAREILDSRGDPTVEVTVTLAGGASGMAAVPSGASTGVHEAHELRDNDKARYEGKGVLTAIDNVERELAPALVGQDAANQAALDAAMRELDGTANKRRLGANAILGVSLAAARAAAGASGQALYRYLASVYGYGSPSQLPVPFMNILNGGRHADSGLEVQEFIIVPRVVHGAALDVRECIRVGSEVFHALGEVLHELGLDTDVGSEGGYAPELKSTEAALDLLMTAVTRAGYTAGKQVSFALDVAASEFFRQGAYEFEGASRTSDELIATYGAWAAKYPLMSIEDGLAQDDWQGWRALTLRLGKQLMLVGDDLFVTNEERLKLGFEFGAANAVIIKPNQIGTLSETVAAVRLAQAHGYTPIVSHRSGETADTTIVDLAVAVGAPYLKAGAPSRGERVAKYNRLSDIAAELSS